MEGMEEFYSQATEKLRKLPSSEEEERIRMAVPSAGNALWELVADHNRELRILKRFLPQRVITAPTLGAGGHRTPGWIPYCCQHPNAGIILFGQKTKGDYISYCCDNADAIAVEQRTLQAR